MNIDESKQELRAQMQEQLQALDSEDRRGRSLKICNRVLEIPVWKRAQVVDEHRAWTVIRERMHAADLAGDPRGKLRRIEPGDRGDAAWLCSHGSSEGRE